MQYLKDVFTRIIGSIQHNAATIMFLFILCSTTFLIYSPAIKHETQKQWDDPAQVFENQDIKNLNFKKIIKIFSSTYVGMYQPISTLTYAMEHKYYADDPSIYHTTNIYLHLLNIILVFWFVLLLAKGDKVAAGIASALFALHPINVETVAWISTRSNLLFALFSLLTLISYLKYIKNDKRNLFYILSFLCFILAILSKSQAIVLPPLIVLFDFFYKRKHFKKQVIEKIPFFIIAILFGLITFYTRKPSGDSIGWDINGIIDKMLYICYAITWYLFKLIAPFNLCAVHYYHDKVNNYLPAIFYVTPFILSLLTFFILKIRKKQRELFYAILFFIISISVTLPFFILGSFFIADRYAYVPYIGLFWFIGFKLSEFYKNSNSYKFFNIKYLWVFILLLSIILSYLSYKRNLVWKNSKTLYKDVVYKKPYSYLGWYSLANSYQDENETEKSILLYHKALKLNPYDASVYLNLANSYNNKNDYWKALWYNDICIELDSTQDFAYSNRAITKTHIANYNSAIKDYVNAIKINMFSPVYWSGLGNVFMKLNKYDYAIECFNKSIVLNNIYDESVYINRGICYLNLKDNLSALYDFKLVLQRNIFNYEACHNIGATLVNMGFYKKANFFLDKAIEFNNKSYESYAIKGIINYRLNKYQLALDYLNKSININKYYSSAYLNKALVLAALKDKKTAIQNFEEAIRLSPSNCFNYYNKGLFYYKNGDYLLALKDFNKSLKICDTLSLSLFYRGLTYEKLGNLLNAERDMSKAIQFSKKNNFVYIFYRGIIRNKLKDYYGAYYDFEEAKKGKFAKNNPIFHNNYGVILNGIGNYNKAITEFNKALSLNPNFIDAKANRGIAYYETGNFKEAFDDFNFAIKNKIDKPDVYYYKAKTYVALNMYDKANIDFTRAINADPNNALYYYERAMNKTKTGNTLGAISDFNEAINIDSLNYVYYLNRGNAYSAILQIEKAINDYSKAIKIKPDYADAYFNKAVLNMKNNNFEEAIINFSNVIKINVSDHEAYLRRGIAKQTIGDTEGACEDWLKSANLGSTKTNLYVLNYCIKIIDINSE